MALDNYLIKIKGINGGADYVLPLKFMNEESYNASVHGQDLDSFTNTNGITERTALKNVKPIAEINLIEGISQTDFYTHVMKPIQDRYIDEKKKEVKASIFFPEINGYIEIGHTWYVPDIEFTIESIDIEQKECWYQNIRIAFISNGGPV